MTSIVLFRPYKSIKKSLMVLPDELVYQAKLNSFLAIRAILNPHYNEAINNNADIKYYYNWGEVYWKDLVKYYNYAHLEWNSRGGDDYNYVLKQGISDNLRSLARSTKMSSWGEQPQMYHRKKLLHYYPEQFRRFGRIDLIHF